MTRLVFDRVACLRGGRLLFEDLSLTLRAGEAALVTGANGAGKSSLLRLAAGLLTPSAGEIVRDGKVALAAEAAALDEDLSLLAALAFWAQLDGQDDEAVALALAAMGLAQLAEVPVRLLSTGQRRRATIARVIASGAPIWLLDEPASGLDAASRDALAGVMAGHRASGGIVLAASHQPIGLDDPQEVAL
ncbi:MAG TPA: heme ABC exporter ATP-binding protein CcmA [Sphingomonas sp.]|uniref:heme ABC exporter ATP-binding protein CcmA n=1 Tax=Sphingomonas sp. TaxID=28214 RepID=UPI002BC68DA8|nr:heme ABC exporter ATP-binding protein CcmA [Sphingomonas sp.]HMI18501.1 heme ABC exporter ATP-binding protein CcmA [Sphingomonas sp.]